MIVWDRFATGFAETRDASFGAVRLTLRGRFP